MIIEKYGRFPKPDVVLFDFDNTLYPYEPCNTIATKASFESAAKRFNLSISDVEEAFKYARQIVKNRVGHVAASHSRLLYFHAMFEKLGLGSQVEEALRLEQLYWRLYLTSMELFPSAREFILNLKSYGVKIGLVTDLTAQIQFRKLLVLGISNLFDAVVASEETSGEKVTGAPYSLIAEKLGLTESSKVWMVGDTESDAIPAKKYLGAFSICFTAGIKKREFPSDAEYDSFYELNKVTDAVFGATR